MEQAGKFNSSFSIVESGLSNLEKVHYNLNELQLFDLAIARGEGIRTTAGALSVLTGQHTGRSATDKYYVRNKETDEKVGWENNAAMSPSAFSRLQSDFVSHADGKELFVQDLYGGADEEYKIAVRVVTEFAWHALFIRHLLRRPKPEDLESFHPHLHIFDFPSFNADPDSHETNSKTVIAGNLSDGLVLIGNTEYSGEIKKSVFSTLNYLLPEKGVMPMHCSANVGPQGDSALFFGLSGTGKTTLSSDSTRQLVGDDEHGWSPTGIFNFEGGCYAKTYGLSRESEPEIYGAAHQPGAVLENVVVIKESGNPDFDDGSITQNGRVAYPVNFITNASTTGIAPHPKNIIMLTADAYGILPPISRMTPEQAVYHFLSGYTAKVAGTEKGITGVQATFSTCFGAPFMPCHPTVYGNLLNKLIAEHNVTCWLVNTGWTAGAYGTGHRMPIKVTRQLLSSALDGSLGHVEMRIDPFFGLDVPMVVDGVDDKTLNPRLTWNDTTEYDLQALQLVGMFRDNFRQFEGLVNSSVKDAAPTVSQAAE